MVSIDFEDNVAAQIIALLEARFFDLEGRVVIYKEKKSKVITDIQLLKLKDTYVSLYRRKKRRI